MSDTTTLAVWKEYMLHANNNILLMGETVELKHPENTSLSPKGRVIGFFVDEGVPEGVIVLTDCGCHVKTSTDRIQLVGDSCSS